jgi:hypothetical protein
MNLRLSACLATIFLAVANAAVSAAVPVISEDYKLRPIASPDAAFGRDVAIASGLVVVGDTGNSTNGFQTGAAYVFDANTGSQLRELHQSDPSLRDAFGVSVSVSDDWTVVGANAFLDRNFRGGSAYVFSSATGQQVHRLQPADTFVGDLFGTSVAVNGDTVLVGTDYFSDLTPRAGSAYVFDAATGGQVRKLLPNDSAVGNFFGRSVEVDGSQAIVGAIAAAGATPRAGAAYLFDLATGSQTRKLTASDGYNSQGFGNSVSIQNGIAVIGAPGRTGAMATTGSAYVFDMASGQQLFKLQSPSPLAGDQFGSSVSISNGMILVGAPSTENAGDTTGGGFLFDASTGALVEILLSSDAAHFDGLGSNVALNGNQAAMTAPGDDWDASRAGAAYLFTIVPEPTALALTTMLAGYGMMRR